MLRASGASGELRVLYQRAARLGAWSMALEPRLPRAYTFRAAVLEEDPYWITQRPLDLALAVGGTEWVWRGVEPCREGREITLELRERPVVTGRGAAQGAGR